MDSEKGLDSPLLPVDRPTLATWTNLLVDGRAPDPDRADEAAVNENVRDEFGLDIGSTVTLVQEADAENGIKPLRATVKVVGVMPSPDEELDWVPSSGFYERYREQLFGVVNQFVDLEQNSPAAVERLSLGVERIMGRPVNVASSDEIFGLRKLRDVSEIEERGLLLFALAVLVGAGVLVGQALVRAVERGRSRPPDVAFDRRRPRHRGALDGGARGRDRSGRRGHVDRGRDRVVAALPDRVDPPLRPRHRGARRLAGAAGGGAFGLVARGARDVHGSPPRSGCAATASTAARPSALGRLATSLGLRPSLVDRLAARGRAGAGPARGAGAIGADRRHRRRRRGRGLRDVPRRDRRTW